MSYEELLYNIVQENDRVMVITAENRAAIRNLPSRIQNRFIDVGIAEQTMVGLSAGLALRGKIPVVHALATFLTMRAFEFIRTDIGIGNLQVKLVGGVPGFLSEANGPTHQAIEDVSIMRGIPNINVFCPGDIEDLLIGLPEIIKSPAPFYIRFTNQEAVIEHKKEFAIGKAEEFSTGDDITLISYGILLGEAIKAKKILEENNLSVGLINIRTPKPLDADTVLKACSRSSLIVTIEDHFITGGLYSILCELLIKNRIMSNVLPIALQDKWFKPALLKDVLEYEGFTGDAIAQKIQNKMEQLRLLQD